MTTFVEINGRRYPVTRCPTAFAAATTGGSIPPRERKELSAHVAKFIEADANEWMRRGYPANDKGSSTRGA